MVGLKCSSCGSYNTSRSGNEEIPGESAEEDEEDIDEDSDGGYGYNEDDRMRLALLRQRLGAIIRQWEQPTEEEGNNIDDDIDSERNRQQQQQNMFHSFVNQLQLFQGMLDDFSGQYNDTESEDTESEDFSEQSSSHSEDGDNEDGDNDHNRSEESDVAIVDSNSDNNLDADDEDDSSNPSSPSYSYFSQPHPINLNDIYGSADCESNGEDSNSSWETEEEEEIIGEVGGNTINNNMANVHNVQRQIAGLSGSLGSVTLECQSGVCMCVCVYMRVCVSCVCVCVCSMRIMCNICPILPTMLYWIGYSYAA